MSDINEMRVGDNEINLEGTRVKSSILPQTAKELSRNVKLQGNVIVEGAIFGNNIQILGGNVELQGAVFANNDLHVDNNMKGLVIFRKAAASADTIAAFPTSGRVIFGSDLNAKKVKLKNCFVGGSIYAQEIYIENCVILGGCFSSKSAVISSCIIGTFHGPTTELAGINYLLYPACFSVEPLTYLPGTELYNLSLANLGALFKGEEEMENTGKIRMDLENDHLRTSLVGEDDTTTIVNSYSVSGRVLAADMIDMDKLENHFLIGAGALGTQILKVYNLPLKNGGKSFDLTVENIAGFFFAILYGKIQIRDLSGQISFEELKKSFE